MGLVDGLLPERPHFDLDAGVVVQEKPGALHIHRYRSGPDVVGSVALLLGGALALVAAWFYPASEGKGKGTLASAGFVMVAIGLGRLQTWRAHAKEAWITPAGLRLVLRRGERSIPAIEVPRLELRGDDRVTAYGRGRKDVRRRYQVWAAGVFLADTKNLLFARRLAERSAEILGKPLGSTSGPLLKPHQTNLPLPERLRQGLVPPNPGPPPPGIAARTTATGAEFHSRKPDWSLGAWWLLLVFPGLLFAVMATVAFVGRSWQDPEAWTLVATFGAVLLGVPLLVVVGSRLVHWERDWIRVDGLRLSKASGWRKPRDWMHADTTMFEEILVGSRLAKVGLTLVADSGTVDFGFSWLPDKEQAWLRDAVLVALARNAVRAPAGAILRSRGGRR